LCTCSNWHSIYCRDAKNSGHIRHAYFCTDQHKASGCASGGGRSWLPRGLCKFTPTAAAQSELAASDSEHLLLFNSSRGAPVSAEMIALNSTGVKM
jgi:hypothetical protein